jgi:hypothetical protein
LHEKAFRRLTGATRVVVLDNLREGVWRRNSRENMGIYPSPI